MKKASRPFPKHSFRYHFKSLLSLKFLLGILLSVPFGIVRGQTMLFLGLLSSTQEQFNKYQSVFTSFVKAIVLPKPSALSKNSSLQGGDRLVNLSAEEVTRSEQKRKQPGVIMGNVYDASGRLFTIPGAKVVISASGSVTSIGNSPPLYNIPVDQNGHYEAKAVNGVYTIRARAYLPL